MKIHVYIYTQANSPTESKKASSKHSVHVVGELAFGCSVAAVLNDKQSSSLLNGTALLIGKNRSRDTVH